MPAPMPTMLPSAMPTSKNRSGCFRENSSVMVDFRRSASRTTMSGLVSASRDTVSPKVTRVAVALMCSSLLRITVGGDRPVAPTRRLTDLIDGAFAFLAAGSLPMPLPAVLHEADPFALDGLTDDHGGAVVMLLRGLQRLEDGGEAVAVDFQGVPVEGAPLVQHRLQAHDLVDDAAQLDVVVVHEHAEVVELESGRGHGRLPYLPGLALAVADDAIGAVVPGAGLARKRHPQGHRQSLSQGAGGGLDVGEAVAVRVSLNPAVELAQAQQLLPRKIAGPGQGGVHGRHAVALGQDEAVPVRPIRLVRPVTHLVEVQRRDDFGAGQ